MIKRVIIVLLFLLPVLLFSIFITQNYFIASTCSGCIQGRTILGLEYKDYTITPMTCDSSVNDKASAEDCIIKKVYHSDNVTYISLNMTEQYIEVPSLTMLNTIITTKRERVFIQDGYDCVPYFAVDTSGKIYSKGGCN